MNKQQVAVIVDRSESMAHMSVSHPTRSKLSLAVEAAQTRLQELVLAARKTDQVGCYYIPDQDAPPFLLQPATVSLFEKLARLKPASTTGNVSDLLSQTLPEEMEERARIGLKYDRHVVIITDGSFASQGGVSMEPFKAMEANVTVLGIDFGQPNRSPEQTQGESNLREAFDNIIVLNLMNPAPFQAKAVRYVSTFKGQITIGNGTAIRVNMSKRIGSVGLPTLIKKSKPALAVHGGNSSTAGVGQVKLDRKYLSSVPSETGEPKIVLESEQCKGAKVGKQILGLSEADWEATELKTTEPMMNLIAFFALDSIRPDYLLSATDLLTAHEMAPESQQGFSALVTAMHDLKRGAAARMVKKAGSMPTLVGLFPGRLDEEFGNPTTRGDLCMWVVQLPTMEDLRNLDLAPLFEGRNVPTESEIDLGTRLVDAMMIDDSSYTHGYNPKYTPNPTIERFNQLVMARMVDPNCPVPQITPHVASLIGVNPDVMAKSEAALKEFSDAMQLRRMGVKRAVMDFSLPAPVGSGGSTTTTTTTTLGGVVDRTIHNMVSTQDGAAKKIRATDADEDSNWFSPSKKLVSQVGWATPAQDFFAMLKRVDGDFVQIAIDGMMEQIRNCLGDQGGSHFFDKAVNCLLAFRQGCADVQEYSRFNNFLLELKEMLAAKPDVNFWPIIVNNRITLFSPRDQGCSIGNVEDADKFLSDGLGVMFVSQMQNLDQGVDEDLLNEIE